MVQDNIRNDLSVGSLGRPVLGTEILGRRLQLSSVLSDSLQPSGRRRCPQDFEEILNGQHLLICEQDFEVVEAAVLCQSMDFAFNSNENLKLIFMFSTITCFVFACICFKRVNKESFRK